MTPNASAPIGGILDPARIENIRLSNDEISRYSRHLIMPEVTLEGQRRLKAARVLCIGTGGLGSPIALYLAAAGVGRPGNLPPGAQGGEVRLGAVALGKPSQLHSGRAGEGHEAVPARFRFALQPLAKRRGGYACRFSEPVCARPFGGNELQARNELCLIGSGAWA